MVIKCLKQTYYDRNEIMTRMKDYGKKNPGSEIKIISVGVFFFAFFLNIADTTLC